MQRFASVSFMAVVASAGLSGSVFAQPASAPTPSLDVGDAAPQFSLPGSDGRTYRLQDFRGKQVVVLAWFAKAFTGG